MKSLQYSLLSTCFLSVQYSCLENPMQLGGLQSTGCKELDMTERLHFHFTIKLAKIITKIMASGPIISWQIDGETVETVTDLIFGGSKITADDDCSHETKRCLLLGRKAETLLYQQRSIYSRLWFFQQSWMDIRVGL